MQAVSMTRFIFFLIIQLLGDERPTEPPVAVRILIPIALFSFGILMGLIVMYYYFPEIRNRPENGKLKENPSVIEIVKYISNDDELENPKNHN